MDIVSKQLPYSARLVPVATLAFVILAPSKCVSNPKTISVGSHHKFATRTNDMDREIKVCTIIIRQCFDMSNFTHWDYHAIECVLNADDTSRGAMVILNCMYMGLN